MVNQNKSEKHLIIGAGEVGKALFNVLKKRFNISIYDKELSKEKNIQVLHITFPYSKNFISNVKKYIKEYRPKLIIVHSTVPVGTTRSISLNAVHSPIRGVHPNLDKGIKTFVKYFGGKKAKLTASYFEKLGIKTKCFNKQETTELIKILDTAYYGWNILFNKEIKKLADKLKLDFDEIYTIPNLDYNDGYKKLRKPNVVRPVLKYMPGKIGGHCVVQNCELLDNWITKTIKERNKKY